MINADTQRLIIWLYQFLTLVVIAIQVVHMSDISEDVTYLMQRERAEELREQYAAECRGPSHEH